MKTCSKCGVPKDESLFPRDAKTGRPRGATCKSCDAARKKIWAENNPEALAKASLKWYSANLEREQKKSRERGRLLYAENPELFRQRHKDWKRNNPDGHRAIRRRTDKKAYKTNPLQKLKRLLRGRLRSALARFEVQKSAPSMELIGCPIIWLHIHLASLFKPGMSWENHGLVWEIDHIKPIASFDLTDPVQQNQCFHWTNLQPLSKLENRIKGDTYNVTLGQPSKEIGSRCCQAPSLR